MDADKSPHGSYMTAKNATKPALLLQQVGNKNIHTPGKRLALKCNAKTYKRYTTQYRRPKGAAKPHYKYAERHTQIHDLLLARLATMLLLARRRLAARLLENFPMLDLVCLPLLLLLLRYCCVVTSLFTASCFSRLTITA